MHYDIYEKQTVTLLHSEWPKLHRVLAVLSAIELQSQTNVKTFIYQTNEKILFMKTLLFELADIANAL